MAGSARGRNARARPPFCTSPLSSSNAALLIAPPSMDSRLMRAASIDPLLASCRCPAWRGDATASTRRRLPPPTPHTLQKTKNSTQAASSSSTSTSRRTTHSSRRRWRSRPRCVCGAAWRRRARARAHLHACICVFSRQNSKAHHIGAHRIRRLTLPFKTKTPHPTQLLINQKTKNQKTTQKQN